MHEERSPVYRGYEYRVRLAVSISSAWAELLRDIALHHYDLRCRESAQAGVVNGLRNTACDSEHPSSYPVAWRDLDLLTKIMEQARFRTASEQEQARAAEIIAWICQAKKWLLEREEALAKWDSEQVAPTASSK
jgi:hypothetical protein